MNMPMSFAGYTGNYINGSTLSNQNYVTNWGIIEMIDINECEMEEFKINTPISVKLEKDYGDWIASDSITGIYSFGNTPGEAKKNYCYAIEEVYNFLSEDKQNLTPINEKTLEYLDKILSKK